MTESSRFQPLGSGLPRLGCWRDGSPQPQVDFVYTLLACPSDILFSPGNDTFAIFRDHVLLGLLENDIIDALALSVLANQALFSLDPDSPTLALLGLSPADVFITSFTGSFALYASHDDLGLRPTDNLNALDTLRVPEPPTLLLIGIGLLPVLWRSRGWNRLSPKNQAREAFKGTTMLSLILLLVLALTAPVIIAQVLVPAGVNAQNEPSLAVNPTNANQVVVGFNTDNPASISGFAISNDMGATWPITGTIPLPAPFRGGGDPALGFNSAGQAFYGMIDAALRGIFIAPQAGAGFGPAVPVSITANPNVALDKEYISIDRISPARFPNGSLDNIYVSFTRFAPGRDDIYFSRSTNLGGAYSRAVAISETLNRAVANNYRQGSVPAAGRGNRAYTAWAEAQILNAPVGAIMLQGSTDGGRSFPLNVAPPVVTTVPHPHRAPIGNGSAMEMVTFPTLAVDSRGASDRIYLAWADRRAGNLDICFTRNTGAPPANCSFGTAACTIPFAPPVRINSLPETVSNDQFLPWMSVNSVGEVAVIFYSKLNNVNSNARIDAVCSRDGGLTWTRDFTVSGAQIIDTNTPGFGGQIRMGEYIGLDSVGTLFNAAWTADGGPPANQDIFTAKFSCPATAPTFAPEPCAPSQIPSPIPSQKIFPEPDQVIPITSTTEIAAAAFQSSSSVFRPEVVKVDLATATLVKSFELSDNPITDVIIASNNQKAVEVDASGVNIIDFVTDTLSRVSLTTSFPVSEISVTADSQKALVALSTPLGARGGPTQSRQEVSIFDLATASRTSIPLPSTPLSGITITPNSQKALIAAGLAVHIIDIASATVTAVPLGDVPNTGLVLTPDGTRALVAAGMNVYIIDISAASVTPVAIPDKASTDIVVTLNGSRATLGTGSEVSIIDIAAATRLSVSLSSAPFTGLDVTPDSLTGVIRDSAGAHVIDLASGSQAILPLPPCPVPDSDKRFTNPIVTPNGSRVVFGDNCNINILTLGPNAVFTVPISGPPVISIAVTPDSQHGVFGTAGQLLVVDLVTGNVIPFPLSSPPAVTGASISPDGTRATLLTKGGIEILNLDTLTKVFIDRSPRAPMLNFLSDDGQPPLPPFAERGHRSVLDGR